MLVSVVITSILEEGPDALIVHRDSLSCSAEKGPGLALSPWTPWAVDVCEGPEVQARAEMGSWGPALMASTCVPRPCIQHGRDTNRAWTDRMGSWLRSTRGLPKSHSTLVLLSQRGGGEPRTTCGLLSLRPLLWFSEPSKHHP